VKAASLVLLAALAASPAAMSKEAVTVHAAGSLRAALTELAQAFEAQTKQPVQFSFGASGLLKDRLLTGERSELFASANMEHPQALVAAGRAQAVQPFASNALCALATPAFLLNGKTLATRLLDADVKLGTSTPRADPSGDYAWQMFDRIEATGAAPAGSAAALKARALQLTGGPSSPPPPAGRNVYGVLVAQGQADVFITYCTNATLALREQPQLKVLPVPQAINVAAQYGLAIVEPSTEGARAFVAFLLGPRGQAVLAAHGFGAP
jgi:ABC-type molybdate transport system substrate-binding protein